MGDKRQRRAAPGGQTNSRSMIRFSRRLVEIARGLVGDQQRGTRRQRAGERHALLLAARKLRGVVRQAFGEPYRGEFALARAIASFAPASSSGAATFSKAVIVGISWNDWKTMPIRVRESVRAHPRSLRGSRRRRSKIEPLSGRSSPAIIISSVDLPEPEAPTSPLPRPPDCQNDVPQYMHARGPRPRLRSTPRIELQVASLPKFLESKTHSYGHWLRLVQAAALAAVRAAASPAAARRTGASSSETA